MSTKIKIGWSQKDITPDTPVAIRGQFNLRIATRIEDPLTLTALALEGDNEQAIIVSMDACAVDKNVLENARLALAKKLPDFDPQKLIVSATHTHTGPYSGDETGLQTDLEYMDALLARFPNYVSFAEYGVLLTNALITAVCEAWERRSEGYLAWGYSHAVVGENRRVRYFDDHALMYGSTSTADFSHIEGHVDHSVNLLFTYSPDQTLTGILVNLACPSQASESGQDYVSADFWHDVREEVRRRNGANLYVLPQCSAAGDQSPHRLIGKAAEDRMLGLKYNDYNGRPLNKALRYDIAQRVANAVDDAEPVVRRDLRDEVVMKHEAKIIDLPHWDLSEKEYIALNEEINELKQQLVELGDIDPLSAENTAIRSRIAWCQRAADRYTNPLPCIPSELNVFRLGDIAFVTAPFEYYLDFGDRIKGRSAALQTFVVQLTVGGSYLATDRAAQGLSYGAVPASCVVSPAGGQIIVDQAVEIIGTFFE